MSVLHLTADHRAGGRGKAMADAYERAAEELAGQGRTPRSDAPAPAPRILQPCFAIGQRVIERDTGRSWWVDERDRRQPDLVGVIPDEGTDVVVWRAARDFRVAGPDR